MTNARMSEIIHKAATIGGITKAERDEFHRLLVKAANQFDHADPYVRAMYEIPGGMYVNEYVKAQSYLDATQYPHAKPLKERKDTILEL